MLSERRPLGVGILERPYKKANVVSLRRYVYAPDWEVRFVRAFKSASVFQSCAPLGALTQIKPGKLVSRKGTWLKSPLGSFLMKNLFLRLQAAAS